MFNQKEISCSLEIILIPLRFDFFVVAEMCNQLLHQSVHDAVAAPVPVFHEGKKGSLVEINRRWLGEQTEHITLFIFTQRTDNRGDGSGGGSGGGGGGRRTMVYQVAAFLANTPDYLYRFH